MDGDAPTARARPAIQARNPGLAFADVPRHWFGGDVGATHVVNGVNLLFPAGERFFVRSVRRYLDRVKDPELREQVKGFFGQEGRHAGTHEDFFETLEAQGYDVQGFLRWYERVGYRGIEGISPPALRLSVTVALEHFTALLAEAALTDRLLDQAHPAMRALLLWHASEEIEHKAVAFDVLREVNPSYALRIAGLGVATACLVGFWCAATFTLLRQERIGTLEALRSLRTFRKERAVPSRVIANGIRSYLRRDFHPLQNDNLHLAKDYLASAGLL